MRRLQNGGQGKMSPACLVVTGFPSKRICAFIALIRVRVLHKKAYGSGRHVKSMDLIEISDADADEGRERGSV